MGESLVFFCKGCHGCRIPCGREDKVNFMLRNKILLGILWRLLFIVGIYALVKAGGAFADTANINPHFQTYATVEGCTVILTPYSTQKYCLEEAE